MMGAHLTSAIGKYTKNKIQATSDANMIPINRDHSAFTRRLVSGLPPSPMLSQPFSYAHQSGGHWGHAGVTRIDLHFRKRAAASWLLLVRLHHVENYGRIFGGWLIGIDPSLERINLTARCARPSWPLRSLQRGRTP